MGKATTCPSVIVNTIFILDAQWRQLSKSGDRIQADQLKAEIDVMIYGLRPYLWVSSDHVTFKSKYRYLPEGQRYRVTDLYHWVVGRMSCKVKRTVRSYKHMVADRRRYDDDYAADIYQRHMEEAYNSEAYVFGI